MLNKNAFANSIAVVVALVYIVFYVFALFIPGLFEFVFNAQFFGADVAGLIPEDLTFANFLGTLVVVVISGWIMGYLWAWLYNKFSR